MPWDALRVGGSLVRILTVGLWAATLGCGDDAEGEAASAGEASGDTESTATGGGGSESGGGTSQGDSDNDSDSKSEPEPEPFRFDPHFGIANRDDDDGNGKADWTDAPFDDDDDLAPLVFPQAILSDWSVETLRLALTGDTEETRLWDHGAEPLLGANASSNTAEVALTGEGLILTVEFADYYRAGELLVEGLDSSGAVVASDTIPLRSAPLLLNHHLQPAEQIWAVSVDYSGGNDAVISGITAVAGGAFSPVHGPSVSDDVWIQDQVEFATYTGDAAQRGDTIVDSIRDRGLKAFPPQIKGTTFAVDTWGQGIPPTTYDSFGNLVTSPPVTAGGIHYPFGRIYYGRHDNVGLVEALGDFLGSQEVQAPVEVDTRWLCIGHVVEFATFIPDPGAAKGFKLLIADIDAGYALLEAQSPATTLPRYAPGWAHGIGSIGAMVNDAFLRQVNEDLQSDILDPILGQYQAEFGITEEDVIRVPSLFEPVSGCGSRVASLIPGTVNLTVWNPGDGGPIRLLIPDPFLRSESGDQSADPLIAWYHESMPTGIEPIFLDGWRIYHLGLGEIHCGTNVRRSPAELDWWETAAHLSSKVD